MDDTARLQLQKMITANNVEDNTNLIRQLKHSVLLQKDINQLELIKLQLKSHELDEGNEVKQKEKEQQIYQMGIEQCSFLFTYYTDLFNRIRKNEIDMNILNKFLNVLQNIEDGKLDQHEGSFAVGSLLKEMYIDSALRKADKLNEPEIVKKESIKIDWKEYKEIQEKKQKDFVRQPVNSIRLKK